MQKYEYRTIWKRHSGEFEDMINAYAKEGWRVVSHAVAHNSFGEIAAWTAMVERLKEPA